jgi:protein-disulfide isomerase
MKNKVFLVLFSLVVLGGLFFAATKYYRQIQEKQSSSQVEQDHFKTLIRDYSPRLGRASAKVYLVEFLDPECESCRTFYPLVKDLLEQYQGQVQLVIRYAPFHGNSIFAVKILESARKQNRYWETLDVLFRTQPQWGSHHAPRPELIWDFLKEVDLDVVQLKKDMHDSSILNNLEQDVQDVQTLGIRMTPSFFINGKPLLDFGHAQLQEAVKNAVKSAYPNSSEI